MASFSVRHSSSLGRIGYFSFQEENLCSIETPFMFPVAFFIAGTTARGGATWKYILQANGHNSLMRRNMPVLSQVLHFLDYNISARGVNKWRQTSIRQMYKNDITPSIDYRAPIFLDSGGFKLMWSNPQNLEKYGISLHPDIEAQSILDFQCDLGGNIVASLDYPLPPGLSNDEAAERMARSRRNAIQAAKLLRKRPNNKPFLYMAVHGLTEDSITNYVQSLFTDIEKEGLQNESFGLAIGSLVPLRSSAKSANILRLVLAAVSAIPEKYRGRIPIHIFGITGSLIPFLTYCGIDTFDSSTYIQEARTLKYTDPKRRTGTPILEMQQKDIQCSCSICQQMDLRELQEGLVAETKRKPLPNGHFKSKYYADIALHNLSVDLTTLEYTHKAVEADALDDYLIESVTLFPKLRCLLDVFAETNKGLKRKINRTFRTAAKPKKMIDREIKVKTLRRTSGDFDINADGYSVPYDNKPILLLVPCSAEKPYSESSTHRHLMKYLEVRFPDWKTYIHKVTLSGLYGPVPIECEIYPQVIDYEYKLLPENKDQIAMCTERLVEYLVRHEMRYSHFVAYGTSRAYRTVFVKASKQFTLLSVFPEKPKSQTLGEFFRGANIEQLLTFLQHSIQY